MGILYLTEPGTTAHLINSLITVQTGGVELLSLPFNQVKGMIIFSGVNITTQLSMALLEAGCPVTFLSSRGKYFGRLETVRSVNVLRQLSQIECMNDTVFCSLLAKSIILAKAKNSLTVLKAFARHHPSFDVDYPNYEINRMIERIEKANQIEVMRGYEGQVAKVHFECLSQLVQKDYKFHGRSRNPPRDPFNSLLSFGYTLLMFDFYTLIQIHGLHPYFGFIHKPKNGHAALASDLMEPWRSVLVDAFVLHLANRNMFHVADFIAGSEGGIYLNNENAKLFVRKYEERVKKTRKNPDGIIEFNYRSALENQVLSLVSAIEHQQADRYVPFCLRA